MENATKALLMAAGVLITIIVLTIGMSLYSFFSNNAREFKQTLSDAEISKFNSKFEPYIGRTDIKAQEVVSVVNLANELNNQIEIIVKIGDIIEDISNPEEFLKDNVDKIFECKFKDATSKYPNPIYDASGKMVKLTFTS